MAIDKLLILQNVQTTLEGITVANGYRTDVETVEAQIKVWSEVGVQAMPWLGFGVIETVPQPPLPGDQVMCAMRLAIAAHINPSSATQALIDMCGLEDDVIGAMCEGANTNRGSDASGINAIQTKWVRTQDDVQDPTVPDSRGRVNSMVLEFEIQWMRSSARSPA